jgi:hypothetical protein
MKMSDRNFDTLMPEAELKSFRKPDEIRKFPKGRLELIRIGGATISRAIYEPGWRWSTSIKPIAGSKSCDSTHFQYHLSGVMKVIMDNGTEYECHSGDVSLLPGCHDAWVLGDKPAVVVDFQGVVDQAKSRSIAGVQINIE